MDIRFASLPYSCGYCRKSTQDAGGIALPASTNSDGPITLDEAKRVIDLVKESFGGDHAAAEKALRAIQDLTGAAEIGRLREAIEGVRELTHPI